MWKSTRVATLAAGLSALTIVGASLASAQQQPAAPAATETQRPAMAQQDRAKQRADDAGALTDARIAGLKAGLRLTAEQEKNWPPVEAAIRDMDKQRQARMSERREARAAVEPGKRGPRMDAMERLRTNADRMAERAAGLKKFADASEPLYKSLDAGQKRRFAALVRQGMRGDTPPRARMRGGR